MTLDIKRILRNYKENELTENGSRTLNDGKNVYIYFSLYEILPYL